MWISTDPALGENIPQAPVNDEIRKNNQNLPGMGGIFNHINGNLYHYAGNNPVKYTDPDGRVTINSRCDFFMNGRSTVLGIQPNRGPNALPSPDGSSPAKELTIGSYGCVVTFFASLASTISGLKITPEIINQYCIDNNLFDVDTSDDYKDQTLLSVENGCKAINGLLEKNNIKNIKIDICQLMSDRKNIIIEACIGIKIFTWTLVLLFTIPLVFLIITIIKYSDYSPVYFYVIICIVLINFGLLSEMLGTKIIVSYDSIIIVKRFFQKNEIKIKC